ncbi:MAG: CRTAC1 family protein [Pirellulales bacterium]
MDGGLGLVLRGLGDATFEPLWPRASGVLVTGDAKALTQADLNGDGRLDLLVSRNDARVAAFELGAPERGRVITVRLVGPAGDPTSVGARVTLHSARGRRQTAEVTAGGGYLSQSAAALAFGLEAGDTISRISVRWPDGKEEDLSPQLGADGTIRVLHSSLAAPKQP